MPRLGNPLTPLIILSHDYFAGNAASSSGQKGTAGESIRVRSAWEGSEPDDSVKQQELASLSMPSYKDPASPYADKNILECQKPMNLVLLDENVSLDWHGHSGTVIKDGFEIIEKAKQVNSDIKIVVLSALSSDTFIKKTISLGANYYMLKPVNFEILAKRVFDLFEEEQNASAVLSKNDNDKEIEEKITNIFITVGIPAHIKGYQFLREAIKLAMENPDIIN